MFSFKKILTFAFLIFLIGQPAFGQTVTLSSTEVGVNENFGKVALPIDLTALAVDVSSFQAVFTIDPTKVSTSSIVMGSSFSGFTTQYNLSGTTLTVAGATATAITGNPTGDMFYILFDPANGTVDSSTVTMTSFQVNEAAAATITNATATLSFVKLDIGQTSFASNVLSIPIRISNAGSNILSYQFDIVTDNTNLTFSSITKTGTISSGYTVESNASSNTVKIAGAGTSALTNASSPDDLIILNYTVASGAATATNVSFANLKLNETTPVGKGIGATLLSTGTLTTSGSTVTIPIKVPVLAAGTKSFGFDLVYNSTDLTFSSISKTSTISSAYTVDGNVTTAGNLRVAGAGTADLVSAGLNDLLFATFTVNSGATSPSAVSFANVSFNEGIPVAMGNPSSLTISTNSAPVFSALAIGAKVGVAFSYQIAATDADNDAITYAATGEGGFGLTTTATGLITGTPTGVGTVTFTVTATDANGAVTSGTFTIIITEVNLPPIVVSTSQSYTVTVGKTVSIDLGVSDPEGAALSIGNGALPAGLTITDTGILSGVPTTTGITNLIVVVSDGVNSINFSLNITVIANEAPIIIGEPLAITATQGDDVSFQIVATDTNSDPITFSYVGTFPIGVTGSSTGLISGTVLESGIFTISVTASDGSDTDLSELTITIAPAVNIPPVISIETLLDSVDAGTAYIRDIKVLTTDSEWDSLRFSVVSDPIATGMTIDSTTGILSWADPIAGEYAITITVKDQAGATDNLVLTLKVKDLVVTGNPPVFDPAKGELTGKPGDPINFELLSTLITDADEGDVFKYTMAVTPVTEGILIDSLTGVITWETPVVGEYVATITATDKDGLTGTFELTLKIVSDILPPEFDSTPTATVLDTSRAIISFSAMEDVSAIISYYEVGSTDSTHISLELAKIHSYTITGLTSNTEYGYKVVIKDAAGNETSFESEFAKFKTLEGVDTNPPKILNDPLIVGITDNSAIITWDTDEASTSYVEVLISGGLPDTIGTDALLESHTVELTGLLSDQSYGFRVISTDASGNTSSSESFSFTTLSFKDIIAPVATKPFANGITDSRATVFWKTDEVSTGTVFYKSELDLAYQSVSGTEVTTDHSVNLTNLTSASTYSFYVVSEDVSENKTTSDTLTFMTSELVDEDPPMLAAAPEVLGITENEATISWKTDEIGTSFVDYGLTSEYELPAEGNFDLTENHTVLLTNLTNGTVYHFRLRTSDNSANEFISTDFTFETLSEPDILPAELIGKPIVLARTNNLATIEWATDEDADAVIYYGISADLLDQKVLDQNISSSHNITLTKLENDTPYYFSVSGTDASDNTFVSDTLTFRTKAIADEIAPNLTQSPSTSSITDNSALIRWQTDEVSDSKVDYGVSKDALNLSRPDPESTQDHKVLVTNLDAGIKYFYTVSSSDLTGNTVTSEVDSFTTETVADITSPKIETGPYVSGVTNSSATIEWITDEASSSIVVYGQSGADTKTLTRNDPVTSHKIELTKLEAGKQYFYFVKSADLSLNETSTEGNIASATSFYTKSEEDIFPPSILEKVFVKQQSKNIVEVTWSTDEASDSYVYYGTTDDYLDGPKGNAALKEDHRVLISNLLPDTDYKFYVVSTDQSKNLVSTIDDPVTFHTPIANAKEKKLKIISGPDVIAVTENSATVAWTTNKPFPGLLYKQVSAGIWDGPENSEYKMDHVLTFNGLEAGTRYEYYVGGNGNGEYPRSPHKFLRTLSAADILPPVKTAGPQVFTTEKAASFQWETDEASNTVVYFLEKGSGKIADKKVKPKLTKKHSITVSSLKKGVEYLFAIASTDASGNTLVFPEDRDAEFTTLYKSSGIFAATGVPGGFGNFFTSQVADTQKPIIIEAPRVVNKTATTATIAWKTDERSNSFVEFGLNNVNENLVGSSANDIEHSITLTDLEPNTSYNFLVKSTDINSNGPSTSSEFVLSTSADMDETPPVITTAPYVLSSSNDQATISWETDEPSDTYIEFAKTEDFLTDETVDRATRSVSDDVKYHNITLTNLESNTMYYYRVNSTDIDDNGPAFSEAQSFTTAASADVTPPVISDVAVSAITNSQATITWTTDEISNTSLSFGKTGNVVADLEGSFGNIDYTSDHSVTLTNLDFSTTYKFSVTSADQFGNEAAYSEIVSFETAATADTTPPEVPSAFTVEAGDGAVYLSWTAVADASGDLSGYNIYRKTDADFKLIESNYDGTFYYDYGVTNGELVTYKVSSIDLRVPYNESAFSAEDAATPSTSAVPSMPVLNYPLDGEASPILSLAVFNVISIRPVTYEFMVATDSEFLDVVEHVTLIPEGSGLTIFSSAIEYADGTYYWKARATDGIFDGPWMTASTVVIDITTAVELVSFVASQDENTIELVWETANAENNAGFNLYRSVSLDGEYKKVNTELITSNTNQMYEMEDKGLEIDNIYYYKLEAVSSYGYTNKIGELEVLVVAPKEFRLHNNYPNPFNPVTNIKFELPKHTDVRVIIYNILGQEIKTLVTEKLKAGYHTIKWNGTNNYGQRVSSGIYIVRIVADKFVQSKKMLLIK